MLPETNEVWIRVVGVLVFNIGILYVVMAQTNHQLFPTVTVYLRALILVWFIVFVLIEWAPAMLILFGVVDFAGALWTYLELKKQKQSQSLNLTIAGCQVFESPDMPRL